MSDELLTAEPADDHVAAPKRSAGDAGVRRLPLAVKIAGGVIAAGLLLSLLAVGAFGVYLFSLSQDLPDYEVLAEYKPPVTTRVYANNGELVAEFARERRLFVPIESMPDLVKDAFRYQPRTRAFTSMRVSTSKVS